MIGLFLVLLVVIVLSCDCTTLATTTIISEEQEQEQEQEQHYPVEQLHPVLSWLISKEVGGYLNTSAVVFRNGNLVATSDMKLGDEIMTIPPLALFGPPDYEGDIEEWEGSLECATARRLAYEYDYEQENSFYWPYLQYVFEVFPHATVPIGWSMEGKELIRSIVGDSLHPQEFGDGSYLEDCGDYDEHNDKYNDNDDEDEDDVFSFQAALLETAWRIVVSRGWNYVMVPVFDMINHRNYDPLSQLGHNTDRNQNYNLEVDGDFHIVAVRDIPQGTPLYNTYNQCHDVTCRGLERLYLTPHIFRDYGFVEDYPRRFRIHDDTVDDEDDDNDVVIQINADFTLTWLEGTKTTIVQRQQLQTELLRILYNTTTLQQQIKQHPHPHEANAALQYYTAVVEFLQLVLEDQQQQNTTTTTTTTTTTAREEL